MTAAKVFQVLADLAPAGKPADDSMPATDWTPLTGWDQPITPTADIERLASVDALHHDERLLRRAWGIVTGYAAGGKAERQVTYPLVTQPVRLTRQRSFFQLVPAGDRQLSPLINDPDRAAALERELLYDLDDTNTRTLQRWLDLAQASAQLDAPQLLENENYRGLPVTALYAVKPSSTTPPVAANLLQWSERDGLEDTALAAVYGLGNAAQTHPSAQDVTSPLQLDPDQATAVTRARTEPVTVISGAPGCGKSHTLAAIALDAIGRGGSVLMATQSVHAADVLAGLLARQPGPAPVLFGDGEKRDELITTLTSGANEGQPRAAVGKAERDAALAQRAVTGLEAEVSAALELEQRAARAPRVDPVVFNDAPGLLEADLDAVAQSLHRAQHTSGLFAGWRRRRAAKRLNTLTRSALQPQEQEPLLEAARDHRAAAVLASTNGTDLGPRWQRLAAADQAARAAVGLAMRHRAESAERRGRAALRAMAALGSALRAGRIRRRQALAGIDPGHLLTALPLWIGTVTDVEDLLPPRSGMFDLIILDEASHIDQLRAAPVLARARRAVVAGDPKQLRFVSFVSDATVDDLVSTHGLEHIADRLDVRRNSAYDLAAGAAPVTMLNEHYRSVPHLIGFSSVRFYGGRVSTATRHPRNDSVDAIEVHHVDSSPADKGVLRAEVDAVVKLADELIAAGGRDIAIITPFRPQADAIEAELLRRYRAEEILEHGLRAGTVHAFQGSEAATVIASLAVHDDDSPSRRRFAADQQLFNVLVTRAKQRLHLVTAVRRAGGLIGDFVEYGEHPPTPPPSTEVGGWARRLAAELERAGARVTVGYPVGRWTVDVCLEAGDDAVGLICGPHPDGAAAHLARQRVLHHGGWRLRDAFASRYRDDPVTAALQLLAEQRHP